MPRILVVDDDEEIRKVVGEYLVSLGYEVATASDVVTGMDQFHRNLFDLIISDYNMPLLSGLDMLSYLNEKKIEVPVIWVSGHADSEIFRTAWKSGLFEFLEKPFTMPQLKEAVDKALTFGKTTASRNS